MKGTLHFVVDGGGITELIRDIFHFEDNPTKAMDILRNFHGISLEESYKILEGDAKLVTTEDGKGCKLVFEENLEFKNKLEKHKKFKKESKEKERISQGKIRAEETRKELDLLEKEERIDRLQKLRIEAKLLCESCHNEKTDAKCTWFVSCHEFERRSVEMYPVKEAYCELGKDEWFIDFCGIPIPKNLVDKYTSNILERIKRLNKIDPIEEGYKFWWDVERTEKEEKIRGLLHAEILHAAGFEVMDMGYASHVFRAVVENYIEKRVKLLGGY